MYLLTRRRAEGMFLASLLVLAITLIIRALQGQPDPTVAITRGTLAPAARELSAASSIAELQEQIRTNPEHPDAYALLGLALLQRVRVTADPQLYTQAEQAFTEALKRDPHHVDALIGQGSLALSRHQFAEALRWGQQAQAINPYRAQVYGIIGDAQVELGQYDAAITTIQKMVDTRPNLSSYSRASYLRELQGDTAGAIDAMQRAIAAGNPIAEETRWTQVQLGQLYFNSGDLTRAEQTYTQALASDPEYAYALAGIARVRAAQGHYGEAIEMYRALVERLPVPEFVIALGELYEVTGDPVAAQEQYDLMHAIQQLNASAGIDVDMELALFAADHGADPAQTVEQARTAYAHRPGIYAADALAWALYHNGNYAEAWHYSQEALRLGTRDAALHYRAGMIAYALGEQAAAREQLEQALAINPYFSIRAVPQARKLLEKLGG